MLYVIDNNQPYSDHRIYFIDTLQPRESMELFAESLEMTIIATGQLDWIKPKSMTLAEFCDTINHKWVDYFTTRAPNAVAFCEEHAILATLPESFALEAGGEFLEAWRAGQVAR